MEPNINHISMITNFLDVGFKSKEISTSLKAKVNDLLRKMSAEGLDGWKMGFTIVYTNGNQLLISKNKIGTRSSDRIKEITVHIPVPEKKVVSWGVEPEQHVYDKDHLNKLLNNFWGLDVDYANFSNRTDYIMDCMRRAINLCFEKGYTVNGIKLSKKE